MPRSCSAGYKSARTQLRRGLTNEASSPARMGLCEHRFEIIEGKSRGLQATMEEHTGRMVACEY